ncbi:hypothetical protein EJB05_51915, partial [Eragrostis curvula]
METVSKNEAMVTACHEDSGKVEDVSIPQESDPWNPPYEPRPPFPCDLDFGSRIKLVKEWMNKVEAMIAASRATHTIIPDRTSQRTGLPEGAYHTQSFVPYVTRQTSGVRRGREVWYMVIKRLGLQRVSPMRPRGKFWPWWRKAAWRVQKQHRKGFNPIVILTAWLLWKHRNYFVFNGMSPSAATVVGQVWAEARLWGLGERDNLEDGSSNTQGKVNPLPSRREDEEHHGGEEPGAERQVGEHLLDVVAGDGEVAGLHGGVAERHGEEHDGREDGVHVVHPPYPEPAEVPEHLPPALGVGLLVVDFVPGVVEHQEPLGRGHAVVELAVAAEEAVGEGEEEAGEDAEVEQRRGESPRLVKDGDSDWNASAVPVGSSFARLATLVSALSMAPGAVGAGESALSGCRGWVASRKGLSRITSAVVAAAADAPSCEIGIWCSPPLDDVPGAAIVHANARVVACAGVERARGRHSIGIFSIHSKLLEKILCTKNEELNAATACYPSIIVQVAQSFYTLGENTHTKH